MGKLTDVLRDADADNLRQQWEDTKAADEFGDVLPPGEYIAHIITGELVSSRSKGTPGYKLTFKVIEGEYANRRFWHDCWLTEAALPNAKRDLLKLGVKSPDQLEKPLPKFIRCKVKLTKRRDDDGNEFNRVRSFEVLGIDPPEQDPYAPTESGDGPQKPPEAEAVDSEEAEVADFDLDNV